MSNDTYTETTRTGWFSRIGSSIKNIFVGALLVLVSLGALVWNEGRAVKTAKALKEGAGIVRQVDAAKVDGANEGKLVHVSAPLVAGGEPTDEALGIRAAGLRLDRVVEMYQWAEQTSTQTKKKLGGGEEKVTTYTYVQQWSRSPIGSDSFKKPGGHTNPAMPIEGASFVAPNVTLGAYSLTSEQASMFGSDQALPVTAEQQAAAAKLLNATVLPTGTPVSLVDGAIYGGKSATNPAVGDVRISYTVRPVGDASIVAKQVGGGFGPYTTKNGRQLLLTQNGTVSAQTMFDDAKQSNKVLTWILRFVFLLLLFIAWKLIMSIAGVLADVVPFFGTVARFGTSAVAAVLTAVLGSVVIAIAWLVFRPLISLGVLVLGAAIAFAALRMRGKGAKPAVAAAKPAPKVG